MKQPGLRTGADRFRSRGYTLLEVLLTVSILSIAFTFLFPSLFRSADRLRYLSQRQTARAILENKMVDSALYFKSMLSFDDWPTSGNDEYFGFQYSYQMESVPVDPAESVQQITWKIQWEPGEKSVSSQAYVAQ